MGPYAEQWSLQVVRPSVAAQMLWNNPFDLSKSINFNALTEPVPDLNHQVAFTPSDRLNVFFTRRPRDSTIRRDFTARFLYEEESVVLMGDELWPVLIYHVVYQRDIDFTLDQLEYEVHLSSSRRAGRGPRNPNYTFEWSRNKIEHKIYHRFYQYWIDAEEKKWVVRERGTNKFVRGRRNAIEQESFTLWMSRTEDVHPAWRESLRDFEVWIEEATDNEWVIDYHEHPEASVIGCRLCGRVDWTGRRPRMISAFPSWNGHRRRTWDDIRHLMDSGSGKDLGFRMFWAVWTFFIFFLLIERLRGEGNESGPPPKPSTLSKWSEDGGPLWLRGIASSGHPTRSPDQVGVRC
ncbi:hypothetical protein C8R42DRAFT_647718 [Lentinula raphanica]|nr:hypothetical protein C8R42DRAFT_647718 [Lentinula raphanica]